MVDSEWMMRQYDELEEEEDDDERRETKKRRGEGKDGREWRRRKVE